MLIVDPEHRSVEWLELTAGEYQPAIKSQLLDLDVEDLTKAISWPSGG